MFLARLPLPDPGVPDLRSPARFLARIARQQWDSLGLGVLWGTVWMLAQGAVPAALGLAVQSASDHDVRGVLIAAAIVLALGTVQTGAGVLRHRMAVSNWITAASRTQQLVVRRATELGSQLSREVATGEVVAVTSTDVEKIGSAFDVLARFVGAAVAFFAVAFVLMRTSPFLGALVLVGVPVLALSVGPLLGPLERRESVQRARLGRSSALASDTVAGLRVLRGIGGEEMFVRRFQKSSQDVRVAAVQVAKVRSLLESLQVALPGALIVVVVWVGARQVVDGDLSVGQLVAFYAYSAFLVLPLRTFTEGAQRWTSAYVAARRVVRVLSLDREPSEPMPDTGGESYAAATLFDPGSELHVRPGLLTGVVCAEPDTAEVLALRLAGFGPGSDDVTLAGTRLADLPRPLLRRAVLVQDKDPVLLSGTLEELFDVPRSGRVSVAEAVATASAEDVLEAVLDADGDVQDPMLARITERGRSLSGGQRQRLALARSLVVDPDILILDEPTSAVDAHTESRIAVALHQARQGRTTVVLSASPLVLDQCDEVALAIDGRVVAVGRHRVLLRDEPRYRGVVTREEVSTP